MIGHFSRLCGRLRADRSGVALIEFAVVLPPMLILGLMGIEVANFMIANLRVSQIAMTTADNAARVRSSIDEADINELMIGSKLVGGRINFAAHGRIILSDLERDTTDATKQMIRWQRCSGAKVVSSSYGTPPAPTTPLTGMGPSGNQIAALTGTAVMFVEVVYDYQPIVFTNLLGTRVISYSEAFNVRQRTDQTLKNAGSLSGSALSSCSLYSA